MEHSALHAWELLGQVIALGGAFFVLGLLRPAGRALGGDPRNHPLEEAMLATATWWVVIGALGAALATALSILVDVAETQGATVFGGLPAGLILKFAFQTQVGRLSLARIGFLLLTAGIARLNTRRKWGWVLAAAFAGVVFTSLVSHAAAQPEARDIMLVAQVLHIAGAALWVGVLIHLLAARRAIESPAGAAGIQLLAEIVRRFSPVALGITSLLGISGIWMTCRFLAEPAAVPTSAYGLTLMVKLAVLTPAIYAGWINFRRIRPALLELSARPVGAAAPGGETAVEQNRLLRHFGKMLELEVTSGVLVITVAGILASVSPPGGEGAFRLTEPQVRALLRPHLPVVNIENVATFYGSAQRTIDDLRYAEFTHNWSGVMVCLLGLGWLAQHSRGRIGRLAAHGWPLLLLPFALFVSIFSDPEVWWYRNVTLLQVVRDPQLLEHQLGAVMILILAWLGWRRPPRPENPGAGYALPMMLMAGGILLLGHAHSTLNADESLLNMINVQHAIFGTFIIVGGTVSWLVTRGLFPRRIGGVIWPCCVICLGLYMAFCYREVV